MNMGKAGGWGAIFLWFLAVVLSLAAIAGPFRNGIPPDVLSSRAYEAAFRKAENERIGGEYETSAGGFEAALKIARETDNAAWEAACLTKLGLLHWNQGHVPDAERCFAEALGKAKESGDEGSRGYNEEALRAVALYNSGKDLRQADNLQESVRAFNRALEVSRKIASDEILVKCLRQLSLTFWQMNDLKGFQSCNEEALIIARKMSFRKEEGRCLNNIGLSHWKSANYSSALRYFQEALQVIAGIKDDLIEAGCLNNIGGVYLDLGDYDKALTYLNSSLSLDQKNGRETEVSRVLNNMGVALERKGLLTNDRESFSKALEYFNSSISFLERYRDVKTEIETLNNIGTIFSALGDYRGARDKYYQALSKAISQKNTNAIGSLYNNLGSLHFLENDYKGATEYFVKALSASSEPLFENNAWEANIGLGRCWEKRGDYDQALLFYEKATRITDKIRSRIFLDSFKTGFARNKVSVYESMLNVLYMTDHSSPKGLRVEKMFSVMERAKARAFLEGLGETKVDIKENLPPALGKRESELTKQISSIFLDFSSPTLGAAEKRARIEKLNRAEDEYMRLISEMKLVAPDVANLVSPDIRPLRDIQANLLDDETGLIEYLLGETKSYLIFVSRKSARVVEIGSRASLEWSLRGYLKAIISPGSGETASFRAGERIADEILLPIAADFDGNLKRLIIIPDGILYYLPFETLRVPLTGASGRSFLVERFELSYAPSASSLSFLSQRKMGARPMSLLAVGDPAASSGSRGKRVKGKIEADPFGEIYQGQGFDFKPLPYSRKEALAIAKHFPEGSKQVLLGRQAREDLLKSMPLRDFRVLHFACHGLIDEKVPFRSALVLSAAGAPNEDGLLQAREIYTLKTSADLVVLSACQTGKGRMEKGEGILGLARMFFYSGSKSVISTLWPIEDKSTSVFMDSFYRHLLKGRGKAEALRLAKLEMLATKYKHPFHWAAFVLNGDYGPLFPETVH